MQFKAAINSAMRSEIFTIQIPKTIEIEDRLLVLVLRLLQIIGISFIVVYCIASGFWHSAAEPTGFGLSLWPLAESKPATESESNIEHCLHPSLYWYESVVGVAYRPSGCRSLRSDEAHYAASSGLSFPTYVQDVTKWEGNGQECSNAVRHWCSGSSIAAAYETSGPTCSCTVRDEFLVKNPEDERIAFQHGFEVKTAGWSGPRVVHAAVADAEGLPGGQQKAPGEILTVILSADGSRCKVDRKSEWTRGDALLGGVSGSLGDWLACAGVTLDMDPQVLAPGRGGLPKHLRLMGLTMELLLDFTNVHSVPDHIGVVCFVTVRVNPIWTAFEYTDLTQFPDASQNQTARRTRRAHGIAVQLKVGGAYYSFDFHKLVQFFVNAFVLLQLPLVIAHFFILRCLGDMSEVYRDARKSRFNMSQGLFNAITRSVVAEMGFRCMLGGIWQGSMADLKGMSSRHLFRHISDVCREEVKSGILQEVELKRVADAAVRHLGAAGSTTLTCSQFVKSCTESDSCGLQRAVRLLTSDRKARRLRHTILKCNTADGTELKKPEDTGESEGETVDVQILQNDREKWDADITNRIAVLEDLFALGVVPKKAQRTECSRGHLEDMMLLIESLQDQLNMFSFNTSQIAEDVAKIQTEVGVLQKEVQRADARLTQAERNANCSADVGRQELTKEGAGKDCQWDSLREHFAALDSQMRELRQGLEQRIESWEARLKAAAAEQSGGTMSCTSGLSTVRKHSEAMPLNAAKDLQGYGTPSATSIMADLADLHKRVWSRGSGSSFIPTAELEIMRLEQTEQAEGCHQASFAVEDDREKHEFGNIMIWHPFASEVPADGSETRQEVLCHPSLSASMIPREPLCLQEDAPPLQAVIPFRKLPEAPPPSFQPGRLQLVPTKAESEVLDYPPATRALSRVVESTQAPRASSMTLEPPQAPRASAKASRLLRRRPEFQRAELGVLCRGVASSQGLRSQVSKLPGSHNCNTLEPGLEATL